MQRGRRSERPADRILFFRSLMVRSAASAARLEPWGVHSVAASPFETARLRSTSFGVPPQDEADQKQLIHVLDALRPGAERLLRQRRLHELVEVAVEHAAGVRCLHAGAQVLHHLIRLQDVRADLVAPADIGLGGLRGGGGLLALLQFHFIETRAQHVPRGGAVLVLRLLGLADDGDTGRDMRQAHRGFGLVDVLAAGAAGAHRVGAHVAFIDLDLDAVVDHRVDVDTGKRRMPPRIGVERRDAHEAVHAVLALEPAIGIAALDLDRRRLDAGFFARGLFEIFDLVAVLLGPARIHAQQQRGPVLALGTAGAGMNFEERVVAVRLARQQGLDLAALHVREHGLEGFLALTDDLGVVLAFGELDHGQVIVKLALDAADRAELILERIALAHQLLRPLRIVPQRGVFGFFIEFG